MSLFCQAEGRAATVLCDRTRGPFLPRAGRESNGMRLIVDEVRRLGDLIARCMTIIFFFFDKCAVYRERTMSLAFLLEK